VHILYSINALMLCIDDRSDASDFIGAGKQGNCPLLSRNTCTSDIQTPTENNEDSKQKYAVSDKYSNNKAHQAFFFLPKEQH
jgi:hypothetical protein